jgi:hypothetical protein
MQTSDKNDVIIILILTKEKVYQSTYPSWLTSIFFQCEFSANAFSIDNSVETEKS